jgi:hypothetical protein
LISIEFDEGTTAFWSGLSDWQLDQIAHFIESEFKLADTVGG